MSDLIKLCPCIFLFYILPFNKTKNNKISPDLKHGYSLTKLVLGTSNPLLEVACLNKIIAE